MNKRQYLFERIRVSKQGSNFELPDHRIFNTRACLESHKKTAFFKKKKLFS